MKECPDCSRDLDARPLSDVIVDVCPTCRGVWFDSDELRLAKDAADDDLRWMDVDLWGDQERVVTSPGARACPVCQRRLAAVGYGNTKVQIDVCPTCQGVWLDEGEFEAILEALRDDILSRDLSSYLRASVEEGLEVVSGPESMASEWRDFTTVLRLTQYRLFIEKPGLKNAILSLQAANPFK